MKREMHSLDGTPPSPLWVPVNGPRSSDWHERALAYACSEGARELLVGLEHRARAHDPREQYLKGALTSLRKLGISMAHWLDGLEAFDDQSSDQLLRRTLADDQSARQRLAWELLVELIGFSGTDAAPYWKHHSALLRLRRHASRLEDNRAFFDCRPAYLEALVLDAANDVIVLEQDPGLDLACCWYAKRRTSAPIDRIAKSGANPLSSQRSRFRSLLPHATDSERVALGVSYQRLYSRLSRQIHFSLPEEGVVEHSDAARGHGTGDISADDLRWGVTVVGTIGELCLSRLRRLTGLDGGAVCRLQREADTAVAPDPHSELLFSIAAGNVSAGDIALVDERLVQVSRRETNAIGHARYLVKYIAERPRPEIIEEWRPATEVHTLWTPETVEGWITDALAAATPDQRRKLDAVGKPQQLRTHLRAVWESGTRDLVLTKLRETPPASYT